MSIEGSDKLAEGMARKIIEVSPEVAEWMSHVSSVLGHAQELLGKAPAGIDPRCVNLARTKTEEASLWVGNAMNIIMFGVGAGFRKPDQ